MNGTVAPKPGRTPGRGKWILFAALVALATLMYVGIIVKAVKYGLPSP